MASSEGDQATTPQRSYLVLVIVLSLVALVAGLVVGLVLRSDGLPTPPLSDASGDVIRGPFSIGGEFDLLDHNGGRTRLSDLAGDPVLLFFGYTHCPDICPSALADMRLVVGSLGTDADRVRVVFISVDPERDTPEKLREYVTHFGSGFIGLTGSAEEIDNVTRLYGAIYEIRLHDKGEDYPVGHSAFTYLIGPDGGLEALFPYGTTWQAVAAETERLL